MKGLLSDEVLSSPLFNIGIGLLANRGQPEGLLTGMNMYRQGAQAAQQAEAQKMQQEAMKRQIAQQQAQREAMQRLPEYLAMGKVAGQDIAATQEGLPTIGPQGQAYTMDEQKRSMLQDVATAQPELMGQMLQNQLIPKQPEYTDLARKLQEAGYRPGTPEFQQKMDEYLFKPVGTTVNVNTGDIPLTSTQESKVQDDVRTGIQELEELKGIADSFSDEYLTFQGRGKKWAFNLADKAKFDIGKEGREFVKGFTTFITRTKQKFNLYRKNITGAAAAEKELKDLEESFMSGKMGPTEFKAAFNSWANRVQEALGTNTSFLVGGLPTDGVEPVQIKEGAMTDDDYQKRKALLLGQ